MKCCEYGPCSFLLRISLISFVDILVAELESLSITRLIIMGSPHEQSLVNRTELLYNKTFCCLWVSLCWVYDERRNAQRHHACVIMLSVIILYGIMLWFIMLSVFDLNDIKLLSCRIILIAVMLLVCWLSVWWLPICWLS
jgi:hypothetical protein